MTFAALITPLHRDGSPDNSLPGGGGRPDNSLPGGGQIDNSLPGGSGRPDNSLPSNPPVGVWPPRPRPWPPIPPIIIPPDPDIGISLPIVLPGTPGTWPPLPPVEVGVDKPSQPIVLPPPPDGDVVLAVVLKLPASPKGSDGTQSGLLWYGPGTIPVVVQLPPPGTPK